MASCFRLASAQNQVVIRASPFSILDPLTPTILTGAEYRFHKRFAVGLDWGLRSAKIIDGADEKYNDRYFKLKGEFKVFWHLRKNRWYSGVSGFYMPESYDHKNGVVTTSAGTFNYEQAHIRRNVAGVSIKAGHLVGLSKHWSVDLFGGLGLRLIYLHHTSAKGLSVYNNSSVWAEYMIPLPSYDYDYPERQNLQVELGMKFNYLIFSVKDKR
jgi:hypothetical protein